MAVIEKGATPLMVHFAKMPGTICPDVVPQSRFHDLPLLPVRSRSLPTVTYWFTMPSTLKKLVMAESDVAVYKKKRQEGGIGVGSRGTLN